MKAKTGLLVFCGIATLLTAGGLLYYTPTLDLYRWLELALLLIMLVFFQFRGVGVSSYIKLSLSVSVYLASIFVYGTGEAIWLAVLSNIIYGLLAKIQPADRKSVV